MNWGVVNEVFMILQIRSLRWFLGLVMGSLFLAGATGSPLQVGSDKQLFFDCLKANSGDAQSCSFLYEQLQQCQNQSSQTSFY